MTTIEESGIQFSFGKRWAVRKYDTHTYYRGMSGLGMKGIDFIGVLDGRTVYLIEVKNFERIPQLHLERTKDKLEGHSSYIILNFIEKVENTQEGIAAIDQYLSRKHYLKILFQLSLRWKYTTWLLRQERLFWMLVAHYIRCNKVVTVFYIQLPKGFESYYESLYLDIQQQNSTYQMLLMPNFNQLEDVTVTMPSVPLTPI